MSILPQILGLIVGLFFFLFLFWQRLKEDYSAKLIFDSAFTIAISALLGVFLLGLAGSFIQISNVFFSSGLWFWGGVGGIVIGEMVSIRKFKLKWVEVFEATAISSFAWLFFIYILNFTFDISILSLIFPIFLIFLVWLFFFVDKRYRGFSWYKSGKAGFSGLLTAGVFFLGRVAISYFFPQSFSLIGKLDLVISAVASFLIFFSLYNLSEA